MTQDLFKAANAAIKKTTPQQNQERGKYWGYLCIPFPACFAAPCCNIASVSLAQALPEVTLLNSSHLFFFFFDCQVSTGPAPEGLQPHSVRLKIVQSTLLHPAEEAGRRGRVMNAFITANMKNFSNRRTEVSVGNKDSGCGIGKLRPHEYYTNIWSLKCRISSEEHVLNTYPIRAENRCHFTVSGESPIRLIMIGLWHFNKSVSQRRHRVNKEHINRQKGWVFKRTRCSSLFCTVHGNRMLSVHIFSNKTLTEGLVPHKILSP